ncbi:MAG TPA: ferrous iron transport protein B, partial [Polyangiaceae bacterium]|nr:ferrous iron transport protein B [Polyangiaceae bacterium]
MTASFSTPGEPEPALSPETVIEAPGRVEGATRLVVLVGNPNVGKTTLFNDLTGQNARIGNYPGVTVERRSGIVKHAHDDPFELVDVPGTYSLAARSAEEQIAIASVLGLGEHPRPELCLVVVDAGQLGRNLYLVLQLLELGVPTVVAVNMMDEVSDNPPNLALLERELGVPCVPTDASRKAGIPELLRSVVATLKQTRQSPPHINYPRELIRDADRVAEELPPELKGNVERTRAAAMWALSSIDDDDELQGIPAALRERCADVRRAAQGRDVDREIIQSRYDFIDQLLPRLYQDPKAHPPKRRVSERVDNVLLHPLLGFLAFIAIMLVVFQALFSWSEPMVGWIEDAVTLASRFVKSTLPESTLRDLLTEGVLGGVGNVIVFLPQILLLFLFIGFLEDSGYMARVAYLMDRIMKALGLHGRAFVPMLSGFACAVPAILATRTMERQRDRLLTMLVVPLMTCSARLPVYSLLIATLFPADARVGFVSLQSTLLVAMYVFSMAMTLVVAGILGRTVVRARRVPLLLELPPYRMPRLAGTLRQMRERASVFLKEAGTVILGCTIVLWALLSFPRDSSPDEQVTQPAAVVLQNTTPPAANAAPSAEAEQAAIEKSAIEKSYGGQLGKAIEPLLKPLG